MYRSSRLLAAQRTRQYHSWNRLRFDPLRSRSRSLVAVALTGSVLLCGQAAAGRPWPGLHRLHCDSRKSYNSWIDSVPVIGSRRSVNTNVNSSDSGIEGHDETHDNATSNPAPPPQNPVEGREKNAKPGSSQAWVDFSSLGDRLSDLLMPEWAKILPGFITKLQNELSTAPGSLAEQIWWEAHDPEINPEIIWDASVRVSDDLCKEEESFLENRKRFTRRGLAKYIGLKEEDIHPDDIPTIAMCGSGGGLRALVAGTSSYLSAYESGLFDCVTYTAGVSGSCWLQALYYSSISKQSHAKLIQHLKNRLGVHIAFPPAALELLSSAPTDKYLLSGLIEKWKGVPNADFGIVDLYGLLLAARLMVPKGDLAVDEVDLKISNQRRFTDSGAQPLPIYTAVRHEIPIEGAGGEDLARAVKREAWFQWFEFTPYEFWCEEFAAGIPTWAVGRQFNGGKTVWRENGLALPELRLPIMLGIWGSAFCATLSHYYKEIQPIMKGVTGFGGLDQLITERDGDLVKVHPIDPATFPNFTLGLENSLPTSVPKDVFQGEHLQLMDAGMSNNLPIYPLLRPGRNVDIIIAFDASADVRTDNWLKVVDGYARQRGIKGWPLGAGWPPQHETPDQMAEELQAAQASTDKEASERLEQAKLEQASTDPPGKTPGKASNKKKKHSDLGFCNVWVGSSEERISDDTPPTSKLVEEDWEVTRPDAGIAVVYFPFLANPKVDGVDPIKSDFMSTWNFIYTPEQIDKVVALARANFEEGNEQTKRTVRAVYERKKAMRLEKEKKEKTRRRQAKMRLGQMGKKLGEGDHADQFS